MKDHREKPFKTHTESLQNAYVELVKFSLNNIGMPFQQRSSVFGVIMIDLSFIVPQIINLFSFLLHYKKAPGFLEQEVSEAWYCLSFNKEKSQDFPIYFPKVNISTMVSNEGTSHDGCALYFLSTNG